MARTFEVTPCYSLRGINTTFRRVNGELQYRRFPDEAFRPVDLNARWLATNPPLRDALIALPEGP